MHPWSASDSWMLQGLLRKHIQQLCVDSNHTKVFWKPKFSSVSSRKDTEYSTLLHRQKNVSLTVKFFRTSVLSILFLLRFSLTDGSHKLTIKSHWKCFFKEKSDTVLFKKQDWAFSWVFVYRISEKLKPVYKRSQHFKGLLFSNENCLICPSLLVFTLLLLW